MPWGRLLFTLLFLPAAIACGGSDAPLAIEDVRELPAPADPAPWGTTSRERFEGGPHGHPAHGSPASAENHAGLAWTVPPGWVALPSQEMRVVTLRPEGRTDVACYVTVLRGGAGGVPANVNRWREQMGLPALDAAAIEALPTVEVLGTPAPLVELAGRFTGMDGASTPGAGLLGIVRPRASDTVFVKMTGPAEVVRAERERFEAFCRSLREREAR